MDVQASRNKFDDLPNELMVEIFNHLNMRQRDSIASVAKRWAYLIQYMENTTLKAIAREISTICLADEEYHSFKIYRDNQTGEIEIKDYINRENININYCSPPINEHPIFYAHKEIKFGLVIKKRVYLLNSFIDHCDKKSRRLIDEINRNLKKSDSEILARALSRITEKDINEQMAMLEYAIKGEKLLQWEYEFENIHKRKPGIMKAIGIIRESYANYHLEFVSDDEGVFKHLDHLVRFEVSINQPKKCRIYSPGKKKFKHYDIYSISVSLVSSPLASKYITEGEMKAFHSLIARLNSLFAEDFRWQHFIERPKPPSRRFFSCFDRK